ncbi:hypothetical protein EJ04DRAFT_1985 [Polyplosphaeria fusca]|uniref:Uncharacterized protein n=1 Tax=Polyplosphaeria fusca TaxID=682080 RepID=A0A9P4V9D4_9PLEO|nr:hypothetical protein EJ04DRAFT_1985 [Polyplosphaeria fusca]
MRVNVAFSFLIYQLSTRADTQSMAVRCKQRAGCVLLGVGGVPRRRHTGGAVESGPQVRRGSRGEGSIQVVFRLFACRLHLDPHNGGNGPRLHVTAPSCSSRIPGITIAPS